LFQGRTEKRILISASEIKPEASKLICFEETVFIVKEPNDKLNSTTTSVTVKIFGKK